MASETNDFESDQQTTIAESTQIQYPPEYKVVLYNDDYTTKEFVVGVLVKVFLKSTDEAIVIMESVHNSGRGVAGIYTYDIAATKADLTVELARANGFPLRCEAEPV